jgi:hypothetical protein
MSQPVPKVTEEDVRRIAKRDFKAAECATITARLSSLKAKCGPHDPSRVRLADLKLAAGDPDSLRDEIAPAEYPQYIKRIGLGRSDENVRREVIASDWSQYVGWLGRDPAGRSGEQNA